MGDERFDYLGLEGNGAVRSMIFKLGANAPQLEQIVFSDLVTKINRREKEQTRAILITTKAVYNLMPHNYSKCKRRIPITLLSSITVSQQSDEFVLHIPDEYDYRFKSAQEGQDRRSHQPHVPTHAGGGGVQDGGRGRGVEGEENRPWPRRVSSR